MRIITRFFRLVFSSFFPAIRSIRTATRSKADRKMVKMGGYDDHLFKDEILIVLVAYFCILAPLVPRYIASSFLNF